MNVHQSLSHYLVPFHEALYKIRRLSFIPRLSILIVDLHNRGVLLQFANRKILLLHLLRTIALLRTLRRIRLPKQQVARRVIVQHIAVHVPHPVPVGKRRPLILVDRKRVLRFPVKIDLALLLLEPGFRRDANQPRVLEPTVFLIIYGSLILAAVVKIAQVTLDVRVHS